MFWEPKTSGEKARAFLHSTYETWYILLIAIFSLLHSSMVGIFFLLVSCTLYFSQTMGQKKRYSWGTMFLIIKMVAIFGVTVWKLLKIRTMKKETDNFKEFKYEVYFYESLGFDLKYREGIFEDQKGPYEFDPRWLESFINEIIFTLMAVGTIYYFSQMSSIMEYLIDPRNKEDIEKMLRLQQSNLEEEEEDGDLNIGTKGVLTKQQRMEAEE